MAYETIKSLYVTRESLGLTKSQPTNPPGVNPGQAGFGMVVDNATDIGTAIGNQATVYRMDLVQGSGSDSSFRNGQFWNLYAYTGTGDPETDTDASHWTSVYSTSTGNSLTPKDDLVAGMGKGDDYIVLAVGGGPTHIILDLNGTFTSTPTTYKYDGSLNNGEPTFGKANDPKDTGEVEKKYAAYRAANKHNCFVRGTMIATPRGEVRIEDLTADDLVITVDHGPQPIRWIGSSKVSASRLQAAENLRPIRIRAGALGANHPATDLTVSPQHRILVKSRIAEKMFGEIEVLVAAKQLLQVEGVDIVNDMAEVEYFHMLFDRHEIVIANGAEAESLYTGPEALKSVTEEAREEIFALFPELMDRDYTPTAARVLVSGRQARKLAVRHIANKKPLVAA